MDLEAFRDSLKAKQPLRGLAPELKALWYEARGNWERAHQIVQAEGGKATARVHAYLHRKGGDSENADYWYSRAGEERPRDSLDKEWETLVARFLGQSKP